MYVFGKNSRNSDSSAVLTFQITINIKETQEASLLFKMLKIHKNSGMNLAISGLFISIYL